MIKLKTLLKEGNVGDKVNKGISKIEKKFNSLKKTADAALKELSTVKKRSTKYIDDITNEIEAQGFKVTSITSSAASSEDWWTINITISINTVDNAALEKSLNQIAKKKHRIGGNAAYRKASINPRKTDSMSSTFYFHNI